MKRTLFNTRWTPPQPRCGVDSTILDQRTAFTLVEMLVVITIIAILAGLLLTGASAAMKAAERARIAAEMHTATEAIEQYKNDVSGGAYPPDAFVGDLSTAELRNQTLNNFKRHFNKAFPRHREPDSLIEAIVGYNPSGTPTDETNPNLPSGLSTAEAVVFWMQKFSSDPRYPISGSGGPSYKDSELENLSDRNWITDVEQARLGPRNNLNEFNGRSLAYNVTIDGVTQKRWINFWLYFPANSPQPLLYFDTSRDIRDVEHPELQAALGNPVFAVKQRKSSAADPTNLTIGDLRPANEGKFQLLHCGLDEEWGDFTPFYIDPTVTDMTTLFGGLLYPDGPFTLELADTIVNFSDQTTLEDSQP